MILGCLFTRFEEPVDSDKVFDLLNTNPMEDYSMSTIGLIYKVRLILSKFDPPGAT